MSLKQPISFPKCVSRMINLSRTSKCIAGVTEANFFPQSLPSQQSLKEKISFPQRSLKNCNSRPRRLRWRWRLITEEWHIYSHSETQKMTVQYEKQETTNNICYTETATLKRRKPEISSNSSTMKEVAN